METRMKYLPTGKIFSNRKEAKSILGYNGYRKALNDRYSGIY